VVGLPKQKKFRLLPVLAQRSWRELIKTKWAI